MNKKVFYFVLLIILLGFFSACSNDDDEVAPTPNYATEIAGTYKGNMNVKIPALEFEQNSQREIILKESAEQGKLRLELRDFSFPITGETETPVGDIVVDNVPVSKDGSSYTLSETTADITILQGSIKAKATVSGTVKNNEVNLKIAVIADVVGTVNVTFGGNKDIYDFEEWIVENPDSEDETKFFYAPAGGWSTSNTGAFLLQAITDPESGVPYADKMPVTQSTKEDAHSGNKAARIETIDTKGKDLVFVKIPKVTTGTLFLGKFQVTNFQETLTSTKFGIPYNKKPLAVKGYYKYKPGEVYYSSSVESSNIAVAESNTTDECSINGILYEITSEKDEYLTGVDAYNSPKLVARAELKDGTAKAEYTAFNLNFEFKYGKTYDPNKKYRLSIIFSSSKDGDKFSGAPGSVMFVDDVEIVSE